ncbi:sensor histidine kinase [uncultured Aquimarina sp.]|uniref:ATP-binding protein n=1 Tax=uncultured Aquimarina sp. TaxID=575652 RepID=UPI002629963B|nr:sensor histidine kinase [uncultured Aquimarina sp.]
MIHLLKIIKHYLIVFLLLSSFSTPAQELDSLYNILNTKKNDSIIAKTHGRIGWLTMYTDSKKALQHLDSSHAIYRKLNDERGLVYTSYRKAVINRTIGNLELALSQMNSFKVFAEKENNEKNIANAAFQLGVIYSEMGDYPKALEQYQKAITIYEKNDNIDSIGFVLNSIGIIYKNTKQYNKAIQTYRKAIKIHKGEKNPNRLSDVYYGLGSIFSEKKAKDSALKYYRKSIKLNKMIDKKWGLALNFTEIGNIYREEKKIDSSIYYLNKSYELQIENNFNSNLILTIASLVLLEIDNNNFNRAETLFKKGISIKSASKKSKREMYRSGYLLYKRNSNYKNALKNLEQFNTLNDSIINESVLNNVNQLEIKYETEKKEREIAEQKIQIQDQELDLIKKQRQVTLWSITVGILALVLGITFWFNKERQKRKQQEIENLQKKQEIIKLEALVSGEEKERVRLAQDLHDGINGDLSVIKFKMNSLNKKAFSETETNTHIQAIGMLDNAIDQVRRISHNLAPPSLHNFSLLEAIKQYCNKMQQTNPFTIDFQDFGNPSSFDSEKETAIYRIIQELLNNIAKHAKATEVLVQLNNTEESLEITVEDDGQGFDTQNVKNGIGLQNIASRVSFLKGNLHINSGNDGSAFTITIPYSTSTEIL